jgi:hypothetical protein
MARVDDYSFHSTQFLGVFVGGDAVAHNIGKERFEPGRSVSFLALLVTADLGSGTHDWYLVSNRA